jgi:hypothetical protein
MATGFFKTGLGSAVGAVLSAMMIAGAFGCAETQIVDPPIKEPESKVFMDEYEKVWRAIQLALRKYPVRINNIDSGILETDYIKGDKLFQEPNAKPRPGLRYKITIRVVKGKLEGRTAVKVTSFKSAEIQPDFFSGFQPVPSNGLEETAILYRIGRYLEMEKLATKALAPK